MSSKVTPTLCMVVLLLFFSITSRARPGPGITNDPVEELVHQGVDHDQAAEKVTVEESCEGVGEEECLMRRTLAAHIDYIYTQKQKP
ncbi:phytosulfokines [Morus notabilis]|nr:phytosulfokines [Morus notabilis]